MLADQANADEFEIGNEGLCRPGTQRAQELDKTLARRRAGRARARDRLQIFVTNPRDVYELNTLQFVSARDNLYFCNRDFNIAALQKKAQPFGRKLKSDVESFETKKADGSQ
ncbi:MAG: hypothetical protein WDM77_11970 [Steroidobacteraceae bacterium]